MIRNPVPSRSIGEHGLIGDQQTALLIAADGAVDLMCWPDFDSPTIFAGLLDPAQGGVFELAPDAPGAVVRQCYVPRTNILVTTWTTDTGSVEVTDLLPWPTPLGFTPATLIRRVRGVAGQLVMRLRCAPRPDYARSLPHVAADDAGVVFTNSRLRLTATILVDAGPTDARAVWQIREGETACFALHAIEMAPPTADAMARAITASIAAWQGWASRIVYHGCWREAVLRSALTLKLMVSARHGSIIAAPSFGLPESPRGSRNWDYRACWIRDGSLIANAFLRLGLTEEAAGFHAFVASCRRIEPGRLGILYAVNGSDVADETELPQLAGYGGAQPVRIGNGARDQLQLDIHGEWLDSLAAAAGVPPDWATICETVEYVRTHWRGIDSGIWELRGGPRAHLHSRLLCWVALDRAISLARTHRLSAPVATWEAARAEIHADIWANFRHPELSYFVQSAGGRDLDAAQLMMPLLGFVDGKDPVWLATLDAITRDLVSNGLVWRYRNADGLPGEEGSFAPCMFWYISCLARAGRFAEAKAAMDRAVSRANALGLFAEEIAPDGRALGNFPQGLTHAALIEAACILAIEAKSQ